jgi:hypothetical protein
MGGEQEMLSAAREDEFTCSSRGPVQILVTGTCYCCSSTRDGTISGSGLLRLNDRLGMGRE